uniref:Uncharacterized protein n=1 Tax=Panagrolaimus sp. JU765 TaxID=591449 RepID=A0AC34R3S0_9BILA
MGKQKKKLRTKTEFTRDYRPILKCPEVQRNYDPKPTDLDQKLPRRVREIQKLQEIASNPIKKKKSKPKNALLELAEKHGFQKRPWETDAKFKKRMLRETDGDIQCELLKAKYGVGGRDVGEIKEDYKELDEIEQRKKDAKAARRQKLLGDTEPETKDESAEKLEDGDDEEGETSEVPTKKKRLTKNDRIRQFKKSEKEIHDKEMIFDAKEIIPFGERVDAPPEFKADEEGETSEVSTKKKRLTKNDRIRQFKKSEKEIHDKEMIFDAKEIIPFGERVDAPPEFKGLKKLGDSSKKAGSKDLLLKQVLENNQTKAVPESKKVSEQERQRVIALYRQRKKK